MPDSQFSISAKLPAAQRLLRENGFSHVVCAESMADRHIKVFFVRNSKENARLGIIVGKRTLPGAVDRNCVKRTIREAFRQHGIKRCKLDVVVMVRHVDSQKRGVQADGLKMLFSRVESRCVE